MAQASPKASLRKRLRDAFYALVVRAADLVIRGAPVGVGDALAVLGAHLWHAMDGPARRRAHQNLLRALGSEGLSDEQARRLTKACFRHLALGAVEFARCARLRREDWDRLVKLEGRQVLEALRARGKGALVISGHVGVWELGGAVLALWGFPMLAVANRVDNESVNRWLEGARTKTGQRITYREGAMRKILRALRNNEFVGLLVDRRPREGGVQVPFFGIPCPTLDTAARVALKTGAPLVPIFAHREAESGRRFILRADPEIAFQPTGNPENDVRELTRQLNLALENAIRRHPEQWIWIHRRWS